MKQTAVEFYAEQEVKLTLDFISNKLNELEYGIKRIELLKQAKEMEKNHLINAWNSANGGDAFFIGLHYYQETFKSE